MTPEEIIDAYNVVSQDVQNYTAEQAAAIGNSQRSLGTLAERVASPSGQTSGLANYTYNRTLRPTVDTLTADLVAQGKSRGLETYLANKLREARNAYEDAQNKYTVASTTPKTDPNKNGYNETEDKEYKNKVQVNTYMTDENTGLLYNVENGHVVVNGNELDMTPSEYVSKGNQINKIVKPGATIKDINENIKNPTYVNGRGEIVDKDGNLVIF